MLDLDFIEIGTSDHDTLIQQASHNTKGISIEPLKEYLDKLPNKPNVKKINCAISFSEEECFVDLYYLPEKVIKEYSLSWRLKGCNSIGDYHYQHKRKKLENKVAIVKIQAIPLSKILEDNNVRKIDFLKIDTEGADCLILKSLVNYLNKKPIEFWPKKIQFETNELTSEEIITETIDIYKKLGYLAEKLKNDTILTLIEQGSK
jgi:FkbM family methyltransferase